MARARTLAESRAVFVALAKLDRLVDEAADKVYEAGWTAGYESRSDEIDAVRAEFAEFSANSDVLRDPTTEAPSLTDDDAPEPDERPRPEDEEWTEPEDERCLPGTCSNCDTQTGQRFTALVWAAVAAATSGDYIVGFKAGNARGDHLGYERGYTAGYKDGLSDHRDQIHCAHCERPIRSATQEEARGEQGAYHWREMSGAPHYPLCSKWQYASPDLHPNYGSTLDVATGA